MMKIVKVEPGKEAYIKEIGEELENLQSEVGGYIEAAYPFADEVALVCNEEGKINNMPLNRVVVGDVGSGFYDVIAGPFFIVGLGREDFCSLTDKLAEKYKSKFRFPEIIIL